MILGEDFYFNLMLSIHLAAELVPQRFLNARTVSEGAVTLVGQQLWNEKGAETLAEGRVTVECTPYSLVRLRE